MSTATLNPSQDGYIEVVYTNEVLTSDSSGTSVASTIVGWTNDDGSGDIIETGRRYYMAFDLSGIDPAAMVTAATLSVYIESQPGYPEVKDLYLIANPFAGGLTYAGDWLASATGTYQDQLPAAGGVQGQMNSLDLVAADVEAAIGGSIYFVLQHPFDAFGAGPENTTISGGSHATAAQRPTLTIHYTAGTAVEVIIDTPTADATYAAGRRWFEIAGGVTTINTSVDEVTWNSSVGPLGNSHPCTITVTSVDPFEATFSTGIIRMSAGENIITITGVDDQLEEGSDILTVTYTNPGGVYHKFKRFCQSQMKKIFR